MSDMMGLSELSSSSPIAEMKDLIDFREDAEEYSAVKPGRYLNSRSIVSGLR
jgi:hypothetical protein